MALFSSGSTSGDGKRDAKFVKDRYQRGANYVKNEAANYWVVSAFLANEQWVFWNSGSNQLEEQDREPDRVRIDMNRMLNAYRQMHAKLTSNAISDILTVPLRDSSTASAEAARTAEAILRDHADTFDWDSLAEEHAETFLKGGASFLCLDWDPSAGKQVTIDPATGSIRGTGEAVTTVLSVPEIAAAPGTADIERALWWIKCSTLPPDEAQERYNLPKPPTPREGLVLSPVQQRLVLPGKGFEQRAELVRVLTYYERPNPGAPEGAVRVVVGDDMVFEGPWPFPFTDRLNITAARQIRVKGRWTADSVLRAAVSSQQAYNMVWSSLVEHAKLAGNARFMAPRGSLDENPDSLSDLPGEVVYYNEGQTEPHWASPAQLSGFMMEQPGALAQAMDDVTGNYPASRGGPQPNVEAASALRLLAEYADGPLGHDANELARSWSKHASKVLETYEQYATEERIATVGGAPGLPPRVVGWSGKSLKGHTRAIIPKDAALPRSRAVQEQFAITLKNLYPDMDAVTFSRIAGLVGRDDITPVVDPDVDKANRENHLMSIGIPRVPDKDIDDNNKHIEAHNAYRKSPDYENLPEEHRQLIDWHVVAHMNFEAELLAQQTMRASVAPALANLPMPSGAPPAPGDAQFGPVTPPGYEMPPEEMADEVAPESGDSEQSPDSES